MLRPHTVFVQTTPFSPEPQLQPEEVSSVHWIPLRSLLHQASGVLQANVNGGAFPIAVPPTISKVRAPALQDASDFGAKASREARKGIEEATDRGVHQGQVDIRRDSSGEVRANSPLSKQKDCPDTIHAVDTNSVDFMTEILQSESFSPWADTSWEEYPYTLKIDIASRLASSSWVQRVIRGLLGEMKFYYVPLPNRPAATSEHDSHGKLERKSASTGDSDGIAGRPVWDGKPSDSIIPQIHHSHQPHHAPPLQLWGITLGVTLDFLDRLFPPAASTSSTQGTLTHAEAGTNSEDVPKHEAASQNCSHSSSDHHNGNGVMPEEDVTTMGGHLRIQHNDTRADRAPFIVARTNICRASLPSYPTFSLTRPVTSLYKRALHLRQRLLILTAVPTPDFNARAMRSIVPFFPALDVNVWIWVWSGMYLRVLRARQQAQELSPGGPTDDLLAGRAERAAGARGKVGRDLGDRRGGLPCAERKRQERNWVAISVHAYYLALRRALVTTLLTRSLAWIIFLVAGTKWARRRLSSLSQRWI